MMRAIFLCVVFLTLVACSDPVPPHWVTHCVAGHWGTVTHTGYGRGGSFEYDTIDFICEKQVTQCEAGEGFVGAVVCG